MFRVHAAITLGENLAPERSLIAAVLLVAIEDAARGDEVAAEWLETTGAALADEFLGIHPEHFAQDWAVTNPGRRRVVHQPPRNMIDDEERRRRDRERKRRARLLKTSTQTP